MIVNPSVLDMFVNIHVLLAYLSLVFNSCVTCNGVPQEPPLSSCVSFIFIAM